MELSPRVRVSGIFSFLTEDLISGKLKIRLIICSMRLELESMMGVKYGPQPTIPYGHLYGIKECLRPAISFIWYSLSSKRLRLMRFISNASIYLEIG
jgi:hypothetical protein